MNAGMGASTKVGSTENASTSTLITDINTDVDGDVEGDLHDRRATSGSRLASSRGPDRRAKRELDSDRCPTCRERIFKSKTLMRVLIPVSRSVRVESPRSGSAEGQRVWTGDSHHALLSTSYVWTSWYQTKCGVKSGRRTHLLHSSSSRRPSVYRRRIHQIKLHMRSSLKESSPLDTLYRHTSSTCD